uniref:Nucleotide-diphospho-sugar transferase domain-containing protein n=1 Tax=Setaria italica TaxID=4555 RepID=K4A0M1_SETIT
MELQYIWALTAATGRSSSQRVCLPSTRSIAYHSIASSLLPLGVRRSFLHGARNNLLCFLVGAAAAAACFVLLLPAAPWPCAAILPAAGTSPDDDNLGELLRRAAMDDKTIIMTFTNEAWTAPGSLQDLFLQSFRLGVRTAPLLKHLVVVAVDVKAYERCQHVHRLCYHLRVEGVDYASERSFMQKDYLDMMWRRNRFVFTDVDIIWLRNPLLRIPLGADMANWFHENLFYGDNPYDLNKRANGGFVYARASPRMVAFYGAGLDFYKVCTVHANCLVGLETKLQKLTEVFDEWKQFREKAALLGSNTTALTD